jgi:hypothetical protein
VGPVRWGSGPVAFELRSPDDDILDEARRVFSPWQPSASAALVETYDAKWTDDEIIVSPRPPLPDGSKHRRLMDVGQAVAAVEYAAIWQIVEACSDLLSFHAALLHRAGKSVAIVGPSHSGKSTLAAGLWQSGWEFLCDDLTIVVGGRTATPGPRRVSLRHESRPLLGEALWDSIADTEGYYKHQYGWLFQPMQVDGGEPRNVELSAIFFLKRNGAPAGTEASRLTPVQGALALLPYTNLVRTRPFSSALAPVAELMTETAAWDLPRTELSRMVASVNRLVGIEE